MIPAIKEIWAESKQIYLHIWLFNCNADEYYEEMIKMLRKTMAEGLL